MVSGCCVAMTVHPRMRGERRGPAQTANVVDGSSPHARGTRLVALIDWVGGRFIPACAGNAAAPGRNRGRVPVHPRMRGERPPSSVRPPWSGGSSPHARGTRQRGPLGPCRIRFIPACAGNANTNRKGTVLSAVHPRMRGERRILDALAWLESRFIPACAGTLHTLMLPIGGLRFIPACAGNAPDWRTADLDQPGSSPHARGTPAAGGEPQAHPRFIPACAGNANRTPRCGTTTPVHPRMRGERPGVVADATGCPGSSPHARGTPARPRVRTDHGRFIPACAGNAPTRNALPMPRPVHPRMRGERLHDPDPSWPVGGSSPHARGTHTSPANAPPRIRFIPACAGNAMVFDPAGAATPVHPRMRGERGWRRNSRRLTTGSSPHARGTLLKSCS